jgi:hypothetical protein
MRANYIINLVGWIGIFAVMLTLFVTDDYAYSPGIYRMPVGYEDTAHCGCVERVKRYNVRPDAADSGCRVIREILRPY